MACSSSIVDVHLPNFCGTWFTHPLWLIVPKQTSWLKNSVHLGEFCGSSNIYSSNVCKNLRTSVVNGWASWLENLGEVRVQQMLWDSTLMTKTTDCDTILLYLWCVHLTPHPTPRLSPPTQTGKGEAGMFHHRKYYLLPRQHLRMLPISLFCSDVA